MKDHLDCAELATRLEAAQRKVHYARASAASAELLRRDQAILRTDYEARLLAVRQAQSELNQLMQRCADGAARHSATSHGRAHA